MGSMTRENLRHVQTLFENRTGTNVRNADQNGSVFLREIRMVKIVAVTVGCMVFFLSSAFTYAKLSQIREDSLGFASDYKGDGVFEIRIKNDSTKDLRLEKQVKLKRWATGEDVVGNAGKIRISEGVIKAGTEGNVLIDLSDAYDVRELEKPLEEGDWYYLVLTNNAFAFGQDWTCSIDFDEKRQNQPLWEKEEGAASAEKEKPEDAWTEGELATEEWIWPTVGKKVSLNFGVQANGNVSDHVCISGSLGDDVYAVADARVYETGFDAERGNYVVLITGDGTEITYGHLQEISVSENEEVLRGQKIATMGKTGMASGPNLYFAVSKDGERVDPLKEW